MTTNTNTTSKSLPISSCISPLGDVDILVHIVSFVGRGQHRFVASINHRFKNAYQLYHEIYRDYFYPNFHHGDDDDDDSIVWKVTFLNASTVEHAKLCFEELDDNEKVSECGEWKREALCNSAARYGNLAALKYLRSNKCEWTIWAHFYAVMNLHFHLEEWARNHCNAHFYSRCTLDNDKDFLCHFAATYGYLTALQWARANGFSWDSYVCATAASRGHLHVLQWAHENGCEWDEQTCNDAARNGRLNVLKWAQANGCPWNKEELIRVARRSNQTKIIQWVEREVTKKE